MSTAQNDFSKFRPGWWQFCWMTGVKFNSIHSILVSILHKTQFTVCAAKNLTVFVADSPRCLEWSSTVAAVSRALRELSEPCLGWTREPRGQPKSLGARRQYSQATANNVLPVMTGSPAFLTRPPPVYPRVSGGRSPSDLVRGARAFGPRNSARYFRLLAIITRIDNIGELYGQHGQRFTYLHNLQRVYCMQNYIKPQSRKKYRRNSDFYYSWSTCHPTWRRVWWSICTAHARISREKSLCINHDNYV